MQTFLPYPNFVCSAMVLDRARLGKQRSECSQLLSALHGRSVMGESPGEARSSWMHHPATKMWEGYEPALRLYMSCIIMEWERRGYQNNMVYPYVLFLLDGPEDGETRNILTVDVTRPDFASLPAHPDVVMPPWLGDPEFHAAHRSKLLEKDPQWYGDLGWTEEPGRDYKWPV